MRTLPTVKDPTVVAGMTSCEALQDSTNALEFTMSTRVSYWYPAQTAATALANALSKYFALTLCKVTGKAAQLKAALKGIASIHVSLAFHVLMHPCWYNCQLTRWPIGRSACFQLRRRSRQP